MIQAIIDFFTIWYDGIVQFLTKMPFQITDYILRMSEILQAWVQEFVEVTCVNWVADLIPQEFINILNSPIITNLLPLVDPILWFYPFEAVISIYAGAYTTVLILRISRWVVGFVPTIEG